MGGTRVLKALGSIDLRSVGRDAMLRWVVALPVLMALLLRWGVPAVALRVRRDYAFELEPYYALIASFLIMIAPMLAGMVIGFLMLDQRDDRTLLALQVTPLSLTGYLTYRMTVPLVAGVAITLVAIPVTGLVSVDPLSLLVVALGAAPSGPLFALLLVGFAANKVQGFALMKAAGVLNWPPIIAYFLPIPWQWTMGIVPAYWPVKAFWLLAAGAGGYGAYLLVGLAYQLVLLAWLLGRFRTVMQR